MTQIEKTKIKNNQYRKQFRFNEFDAAKHSLVFTKLDFIILGQVEMVKLLNAG